MLGNLLGMTCLFSLNLVLLAFAAALRMFPAFFKTTRHFLKTFFDLSCRFYKLILGPLAPLLEGLLGINILKGLFLVGSTIFMSLVFGLLIMWLSGLPITVFTVALCITHGLIIGLIWNDTEHQQEFQMGGPTE